MPEATQPQKHRAVVRQEPRSVNELLSSNPIGTTWHMPCSTPQVTAQPIDSFRSVVARFGTVIGTVW
jgi:hypothetical protein